MQRHYVSKIIGDGQSPETAFRPAAFDALEKAYRNKRGEGRFIYPTIPVGSDGRPIKGWCHVQIDASDMSTVDADPDCDHVAPERGKTDIRAILTKHGVDDRIIDNANTYEEIVTAIKQESRKRG